MLFLVLESPLVVQGYLHHPTFTWSHTVLIYIGLYSLFTHFFIHWFILKRNCIFFPHTTVSSVIWRKNDTSFATVHKPNTKNSALNWNKLMQEPCERVITVLLCQHGSSEICPVSILHWFKFKLCSKYIKQPTQCSSFDSLTSLTSQIITSKCTVYSGLDCQANSILSFKLRLCAIG